MRRLKTVKNLIEKLFEYAEADFEVAAIEDFEKKLFSNEFPFAPIRVKVIDDKTQEFNGLKFYRNRSGHYTTNLALHQAVWRYFNGDIPNNRDIHHFDGDKSNNQIENLTCLTRSDHMREHAKMRRKYAVPYDVEWFICSNCGEHYALNLEPGYRFVDPINKKRYTYRDPREWRSKYFCSAKCRHIFKEKSIVEPKIKRGGEGFGEVDRFCTEEEAEQKIIELYNLPLDVFLVPVHYENF